MWESPHHQEIYIAHNVNQMVAIIIDMTLDSVAKIWEILLVIKERVFTVHIVIKELI